MLSGRQALRSIRRRIGGAKTDYDALRQAIRDLEHEHASAVDEEWNVLTDLARAYLPELSQRSIGNGLEELRTRMSDVLGRQAERREALQRGMATHPARLEKAEERLEHEKGCEAVSSARVEATRAAVATALESNAEYRSHAEEHALLMDRRDRIKARRARLLAVARTGRPRYERFGPFRYLRERAFGEPEYTGNWVSRIFDRWLARRIDFPGLDRNSRILRLGPHQIQAEILRATRRAGELEAAMDVAEENAAERAELTRAVEELSDARQKVAQARADRDRVRAAVESQDTEFREIETTRSAYYEEAIEVHRQHLAEKSIRELESLARQTQTADDDALVCRLDAVHTDIVRIERTGRERLRELKVTGQRVDGLLLVEEASQRDFGGLSSYFIEGFAVDPLIDEFIEGSASWGDLVKNMNQAHVKLPLFASPLVDSVVGNILSEMAASFSGALLSDGVGVRSVDPETSWTVRDNNVVVAHRVTRRGARRDPL